MVYPKHKLALTHFVRLVIHFATVCTDDWINHRHYDIIDWQNGKARGKHASQVALREKTGLFDLPISMAKVWQKNNRE